MKRWNVEYSVEAALKVMAMSILRSKADVERVHGARYMVDFEYLVSRGPCLNEGQYLSPIPEETVRTVFSGRKLVVPGEKR